MTKHEKILAGLLCPYCNKDSELIDSIEIYGTSYGMMFICRPCNAYVGTHSTKNPPEALGRLANAELREWKKRVHAAFDPLWENGSMYRRSAYKWLSVQMGIPFKECHIGMFDIEMCQKAYDILNKYPKPGDPNY